jgi:FMN-dependent NADH-azoreductase
MKLLHIDSSILSETSASRKITGAVVDSIRRATPGLEVAYRDLVAEPLAHLTQAAMSGAHPLAAAGDSAAEDRAASQLVLDQFLAADTVVIGAPMYNFSIPSQLKAWLDRILVPGKTFQYSAEGVTGLATDKRIVVVASRGNVYGEGAPAAAFEHAESYLRAVFAFIGITNVDVIVVEGTNISPEQRLKAIDGALEATMRLQAA